MNKKSSRQKSAKSKADNPAQGKSSSSSIDLKSCFESFRLFTGEFFHPRAGVTEDDLSGFAIMADIVVQAYLLKLKSQVPRTKEHGFRIVPNHLEKMLLSYVRMMNEMLCELARAGRWNASTKLWEQALLLSQTFGELALKNPAPFRSRARKSLYMPSLRARNVKFTADAAAIADQIELSAETVGDRLTDNRKRIGALCAGLVAECVDEILRARHLWAGMFARRNHEVVWPSPQQIAPYLNLSLDELLAEKEGKARDAQSGIANLTFFSLCRGGGVQRLPFLCLPELTPASARQWWKQAIEGMVEARFPSLLEQPAWEKELKAVSSGTRADMLKELKDYSRDKVRQFAPKAGAAKSAIRRGR